MIEYQEFIFLLILPTIPSFQYSIMILHLTYLTFSLEMLCFFPKLFSPTLLLHHMLGEDRRGGKKDDRR